MGKERDVPLGERQNKALQFDDPDVCKYELIAVCPNRLFRNTRSDLGAHTGLQNCWRPVCCINAHGSSAASCRAPWQCSVW